MAVREDRLVQRAENCQLGPVSELCISDDCLPEFASNSTRLVNSAVNVFVLSSVAREQRSKIFKFGYLGKLYTI